MSWKIVNQILGLAAIDKKFAQELLTEPLAAIQARGFQLTDEEQEAFRLISARTMSELSQQLLQKLPPDNFKQS